jgi:DNA-directed RNA polymerase specialized sigma24 family protein
MEDDALAYTSELDLVAEWDAVATCLKNAGEPKASIIEEYLTGVNIGEICVRYEVTASNVYTIVSRFRKELRNRLGTTFVSSVVDAFDLLKA